MERSEATGLPRDMGEVDEAMCDDDLKGDGYTPSVGFDRAAL